MKRGGEEFAEVFSSMLARDGAFYRREHDLSKLEANVLVDDQHFDRNRAILTQVSEILGMMSLLSGEVEQLLHRANSATRGALRDRKSVVSGKSMSVRVGTGGGRH